MTRIIRNTTSRILCEKYKRGLVKHLRRRGYNKHILKRIWKMKHAQRTIMLRPRKCKPREERPPPFCIKYVRCTPSVRQIISNRWNLIWNDFRLSTLFPEPPSPVFTSRRKIKSILSKKRCKYNISPSNPNLTPDNARDFKFLKFNFPKPPSYISALHRSWNILSNAPHSFLTTIFSYLPVETLPL